MARKGKDEAEGIPVRSRPSFSDTKIAGLPEGSIIRILTNGLVNGYFSCILILIEHLMTSLDVFYTFT